jgi:mono/diheme cytochrome c family protein
MRKWFVIPVFSFIVFLASCGEKGISAERMKEGGKVYQTYCEGCHMNNGGGVPDMNAPLKGSSFVAGEKEKLIEIVLKGSAAFANDPNRPYKNLMASMANLSDQQLADVLTYIRNSFGNKAPAVESGEVAVVRGKIK